MADTKQSDRLIDHVVLEAGLSNKAQAKRAIEAVFTFILGEVSDSETHSFTKAGFGKFERRTKKGGTHKVPSKTGGAPQIVTTQDHFVVGFKPYRDLKQSVFQERD